MVAEERVFREALAHHQAGRLEEAEGAYRELLRREPGHADALHYLGLVVHRRGRVGEGVEWLRRAVAVRAGDAGCWNNLGNMLRELSRLEEAREAYEAALLHAPGHVNARYHLGVTQEDMGAYEEAVKSYRAVLEMEPDDVEAWHSLGTALQGAGQLEASEGAFREVLARVPGDASAWYNLGNVLKEGERFEAAVAAYREAIAADPGHVQAHYNMGLALRLLGETDEAIDALREALRLRPGDLRTYRMLGLALMTLQNLAPAAQVFEDAVRLDPGNVMNRMLLGFIRLMGEDYDAALQAYRGVLEIEPDNALAHSNMAIVLARKFQPEPDEAERMACRAVELAPNLADAHLGLGTALQWQGRGKEAIAAFERAVELDPEYAPVHSELGWAYVNEGDLERAREAYNKALSIDSNLDKARINLVMTQRHSDPEDENLVTLEAKLQRKDIRNVERLNMHFALGKAYDDCGEYDRAFSHFECANEIKARRYRFDREELLTGLAKAKSCFSAALFERFSGVGSESELPVFVVGMPRSGTTLVEQIIASHPDVYGAGELTKVQDCIDALATESGSERPYPECIGDIDAATIARVADEYLAHLRTHSTSALRVTDKLPGNFAHLGLIALLFPRARVVHCRRDARDVCVSNYFQQYAQAHHYTYKLADLGLYYSSYRSLMRHWRSVLPRRMYEIDYERLVEDQETQSKKLIEYCGLEWDERCLEFHKTRRTVFTASHWQVRQPMYRRSSQRWKHYESHMGELFEALEVDES